MQRLWISVVNLSPLSRKQCRERFAVAEQTSKLVASIVTGSAALPSTRLSRDLSLERRKKVLRVTDHLCILP